MNSSVSRWSLLDSPVQNQVTADRYVEYINTFGYIGIQLSCAQMCLGKYLLYEQLFRLAYLIEFFYLFKDCIEMTWIFFPMLERVPWRLLLQMYF